MSTLRVRLDQLEDAAPALVRPEDLDDEAFAALWVNALEASVRMPGSAGQKARFALLAMLTHEELKQLRDALLAPNDEHDSAKHGAHNDATTHSKPRREA